MFPELNNPNFEQIIFEHYKKLSYKYDSLISSGNRCVLDKNSKKKITLAQLFVHELMNKIVKDSEVNRGLLCWHSTGSGKTCLATGAMASFKSINNNSNIIYLTSVDAKKANPPENFYNCSNDFFPDFKNILNKKKNKDTKNIDSIFTKNNIYFHTFATLSHYIGIAKPNKKTNPNFLQNSLLIIDEIHQIFKPLPNQKLEHDALKNFLLNINDERLKNTKILILTATPGDNIKDIIMLLNIIRKKNSPEIILPNLQNQESINKFSNDIRNLVSYFDASMDYTKFPKLYEIPIHTTFMANINSTKNTKKQKDNQFIKYLEKLKETPNDQKNYNNLMNKNELNKFYRTLRKYSNMLFNYVNDMSLNEFSSKLPYLFEKIENNPKQKHYIYSSFFEARGFGQSVIGIGKLLKKHLNFKEFTINQANQIKNIKDLSKDNRFIIIGTTNLDNKTDIEIKQELKKVKKLLDFYNDPLNKNGEYIQILLASKQFNESIDLKAVRHIHIFEPLVSWIARKQTLGRAVRHCSHKDLNKTEWNVKLHEYISEKPHKITLLNTDFLQNEITFIKDNIDKQNKELQYYTNKSNEPNNKNSSLLKNFNKNSINRKKRNLKILQKRENELTNLLNNKNLQMIDETIYKTAKDKFKELSILNKIIKESAIDCYLFNNFHNKSLNDNEKITCKQFN
jgi:superfamily II DNA or RNA helicase